MNDHQKNATNGKKQLHQTTVICIKQLIDDQQTYFESVMQ